MAPTPRLAWLAAIGLLLAGCTATAPPPTTQPATPTATTTTPATSPLTAADALADLPPAHRVVEVEAEAAERRWLHRGENTIEEGGSYRLRGWVAGSVVVEAGDDPVVLVLDGLTLRTADGPAIDVRSTGIVTLVIAEGTSNTIEAEGTDPAVRSAAGLTLQGTGSLDIDSTGDGITSDAGIVVAEGSLQVNASGDGIRAGEYLVIEDGTITVAADGAGLASDSSDVSGTGYVAVRDPFLTVSAGEDGIRAASDLIVFGGGFEVTTAGGHQSTIGEEESATALKAGRRVVVDGGTFLLDAADDGVNATHSAVLNDGDWEVAAGDDAFHAEYGLTVNSGQLDVTAATEGLEAEAVTIAGGSIEILSSDDALNASEADAPLATPSVMITGGTIRLDSSAGDGLDSNGNIAMTGGDLLILGAPVDNESAIDYDGEFLISGGTLVAAGGAGMAQPPSSGSAQRSLWFDVDGRDGTVVRFAGPDGKLAGTVTGTRRFGAVVISNPDLTIGRTYTVTVDGEPVGTTTTDDADNAPRRFPVRR